MIINRQNLTVLNTAYNAAFNIGFRLAEPQWQKVATVVPSTTSEEQYGWLGQFPRLKEWVGDKQIEALSAHDYAIKNKEFEASVAVLRREIEDDQYGLKNPLFQEMGFAAATHPDEMVFGLLSRGFELPCYDKQYFFDTDHSVGGSSVSNMQSGSSAPWYLLDTGRPIKPLIFQKRKDYKMISLTADTDANVFMRGEFVHSVEARVNAGFGFWQMAYGSKAALTADNFDTGYAAMMGFKSDAGQPLGITPKQLVCGSSNRAAALKTIESLLVNGGESNHNYKAVEVVVVPWLP